MKLNQKESSIPQQTFEEHDLTTKEPYEQVLVFYEDADELAISPDTPTPEAIKKAQFVDKTYVWTGK